MYSKVVLLVQMLIILELKCIFYCLSADLIHFPHSIYKILIYNFSKSLEEQVSYSLLVFSYLNCFNIFLCMIKIYSLFV